MCVHLIYPTCTLHARTYTYIHRSQPHFSHYQLYIFITWKIQKIIIISFTIWCYNIYVCIHICVEQLYKKPRSLPYFAHYPSPLPPTYPRRWTRNHAAHKTQKWGRGPGPWKRIWSSSTISPTTAKASGTLSLKPPVSTSGYRFVFPFMIPSRPYNSTRS